MSLMCRGWLDRPAGPGLGVDDISLACNPLKPRFGAQTRGAAARVVAGRRLRNSSPSSGSSGTFSLRCWHDVEMDSDWDRFIARCQEALGELVE